MYNAATGGTLAATGLAAGSIILGAWVLVIAGLVVLSLLPVIRRRRRATS